METIKNIAATINKYLEKGIYSALLITFTVSMISREENFILKSYILFLAIMFLTFILTGPTTTNKKDMKAADARILTNQSIQDSLSNIEEHPEYIAVCDKIRAAARGNEKVAPKTFLETDIFNRKVLAKLEADGFMVMHLTNDRHDIRW